jgi:hypothetical protein
MGKGSRSVGRWLPSVTALDERCLLAAQFTGFVVSAPPARPAVEVGPLPDSPWAGGLSYADFTASHTAAIGPRPDAFQVGNAIPAPFLVHAAADGMDGPEAGDFLAVLKPIDTSAAKGFLLGDSFDQLAWSPGGVAKVGPAADLGFDQVGPVAISSSSFAHDDPPALLSAFNHAGLPAPSSANGFFTTFDGRPTFGGGYYGPERDVSAGTSVLVSAMPFSRASAPETLAVRTAPFLSFDFPGRGFKVVQRFAPPLIKLGADERTLALGSIAGDEEIIQRPFGPSVTLASAAAEAPTSVPAVGNTPDRIAGRVSPISILVAGPGGSLLNPPLPNASPPGPSPGLAGSEPVAAMPEAIRRGDLGDRPHGSAGLKVVPREAEVAEAPVPLGADLITEFLPFDRESLEASISQFLDELKETVTPSDDEAVSHVPLYLLCATAIAAMEVTRRWRARGATAGTEVEWTPGSLSLQGLS